MGRKLSRFPRDQPDPAAWHGQVSDALAEVGVQQRSEIEREHVGRLVYTGGDDLLALLPAHTALTAARKVNEIFTLHTTRPHLLRRPSASTAVVYFHSSWPLQSAVAAAHRLLAQAKERERPGLGVAVMTRGGERVRLLVPWLDRTSPATLPMIGNLETLTDAVSGPLSGRLAAGLEADRVALMELNRDWREREFTRRALRHGIDREQAASVGRTLTALCGDEPGGVHVTDAANGVLIAQFLSRETRPARATTGDLV